MFSRAHLLLEKELVQLNRENIWGISARPVTDDNIFEWCATIHGLQGTAWEGGMFRVYLRFDENYSASPPEICFHTIPFHPNIDMVTGRPCIDLIDDPRQWRHDYRIYSLLLTVQSMLHSPSEERAVNMEAVAMMRNSPDLYQKVVAECVLASRRIHDGEMVGAGSTVDTTGHDKRMKSPGKKNRVTKLSFDDYYKTWSAIATSKTHPGDAREYLEKIQANPSLQEIHLGLTLKEFSEERKEREERHRSLVYGNLPAKTDPPTSRDAQLAKVNQMRKIYLPRRASNANSPTQSATNFTSDSEHEIDDLVTWTKALDPDSIG